MAHGLALALLAASALGTVLLALQMAVLRHHLGTTPPRPRAAPGISVLKPLCGVDDELDANLASFAVQAWADYEVLLGVKDRRDPAWPVAQAFAARHPGRFRAVLQQGAPGLNPKVNQLVTLARAARHDILVVSDSNVRVEAGYLAEIAAHLDDPAVGLVTHPIAGVGERRLGSLLDHLHLSGSVAPGVVAAKLLAGRDIVVGKSMAFRRADLRALGGFEAAKDVLAEDYVLGRMVGRRLGKRVAVGHRPVQNVSVERSLSDFAGRYRRWAVIQRAMTGRAVHASQALLNPILLGTAAVAAEPRPATVLALAGLCAAKVGIDAGCSRALRPGGFRPAQLLLVPAKDLLLGLAWARGLLSREVDWRGNRIRVGPGTRILAPEERAVGAPSAARAAS